MVQLGTYSNVSPKSVLIGRDSSFYDILNCFVLRSYNGVIFIMQLVIAFLKKNIVFVVKFSMYSSCSSLSYFSNSSFGSCMLYFLGVGKFFISLLEIELDPGHISL
eukprot:snap_masked-scaffold_6-processed-gene-17.16-mRNA-1 protein AED:1.00 eAED:1.00 QI:0/0/0/0/1/1/2/0/105